MGTRFVDATLVASVDLVFGAREMRLCMLCAAVLVCLAFTARVPSAAIALGRARSRLAFASRVDASRRARPRRTHALGLFGEVLPLTLGWAAVAHVASSGIVRVDILAPYLAFAAMGAATRLVPEEGGVPSRLLATCAHLASGFVVGYAFTAACALGGTRSAASLVDAQGMWPWQWSVFRKPALLVAFPLYVTHAAPILAVPERAGALAHGARPLGRLVVCGLAACVFLGGWSGPPADALGAVMSRSIGAALFVAKAWLLVLAVDLTHRADVRFGGLTAPGLALVAALGALALSFPPSRAGEAAIGAAACATTALVVAFAFAAVWRSPHPMGEPPEHPAPFA